MAEVDHDSKAQGKPGSREPNRAHAAEKLDMKKIFMDKLSDEGGQPESIEEKPKQEDHQEQKTSGSPDEGGTDANKQDETHSEESQLDPKISVEFVDADDNIVGYGDDDGNQYDLKGAIIDADAGKDADKGGEGKGKEEPESGDVVGALQVDDSSYSVDDVRKLVQSNRSLDADYRRKTTLMSRMREEYEVHGKEIETVGMFFTELSKRNVQQFEQVDTKDMTAEEFQSYRDGYDSAKRGADQMTEGITKVRERFNSAREKHLDDAAAESVDVLKRIEDRWDNEFYAKVRDFAVDSGRYTAEEFSNMHDWRTMEGMIAVMDREVVKKVADGKNNGNSEISEPGKRKRRRQRQRTRRNAQGRFQTSRTEVFSSSNAKKDGSLRRMFVDKLAAERDR